MTMRHHNQPRFCGPEVWKAIPSAPRYFASSHGRISGIRVETLKPWISDSGYAWVTTFIDGKERAFSVNWLVCEAFHGRAPTPTHQAAHGDNDKSNNVPENLRWATPKENAADRLAHGTRLFGENHGRAKLTNEQVEEIRAAYGVARLGSYVRRGLRSDLASKYGVRPETITAIAGRQKRVVTA